MTDETASLKRAHSGSPERDDGLLPSPEVEKNGLLPTPDAMLMKKAKKKDKKDKKKKKKEIKEIPEHVPIVPESEAPMVTVSPTCSRPPHEAIKLVTVQSALLMASGSLETITPDWILMRNKFGIKRIVVLGIPSLLPQDVVNHADCIPTLMSMQGPLLTRSPGTLNGTVPPVRAFFTSATRKSDRKAQAKKEKKIQQKNPTSFEAKDLLMTVQEMKEAGFPPEHMPNQKGRKFTADFYAETQPADEGLDCEMVTTSDGNELARTTLVAKDGSVLLDELSTPARPVINYNTKYSGITEEILAPVTATLEEVRAKVMGFVKSSTILVGQSIENDLHALRIIHHRVIDTSCIFKHPAGPPAKPSLRWLAKVYLNRVIQNSIKGHDSGEDARASLDLALYKMKMGDSITEVEIEGESIMAVLADVGYSVRVHDRKDIFKYIPGVDACETVLCSNDDDVQATLVSDLRTTHDHQINWGQFFGLSSFYHEANRGVCFRKNELRETLKTINKRVKKVYDAAPENTLFFISTMQGPTRTMRELQERRKNKDAVWTADDAKMLHNAVDQARSGVTFFYVKNGDLPVPSKPAHAILSPAAKPADDKPDPVPAPSTFTPTEGLLPNPSA